MVLKIAGWISSNNAEMVEARIRKQLAGHDPDDVVLDMGALENISGAGLKMIRNLKDDYPDIVVINVSHDIYKTLYMAGICERFLSGEIRTRKSQCGTFFGVHFRKWSYERETFPAAG